MNPGALPILTYHAIDSSGAVTSTEPSRFDDTIDALLEAGFRAIDLAAWIAAGRPPIERGFAITFDDGLRSILNVADRLNRLEIPVTVFLVTDRIGLDNAWSGQPSHIPVAPILDRTEIEALSRQGVNFGSHGCSHLRIDRMKNQRLASELTASRDRLEELTGKSCRLLAYPYGATNRQVSQAASKVYDAAFGTRLDYASHLEDKFHIARIDAFYLKSRQSLDRLISGTWHNRLAVRRTFRTVRETVARIGLG